MRTLALRAHLAVWVGLLALLALSAGSAFLKLGAINVVLNFAIGAIKAALVLVFFMRLARAEPVIRLAAAAGLVWLCFLVGLSLTDFLMRV